MIAPGLGKLSVAGAVPSNGANVINAMTVDVEDYFQVQAFADQIPRAKWDQIPCRVEANVDRLLELFSENDVRASFFTLGWIAERYPKMLRRIGEDGHEIASHGYDHSRVDQLSPISFRVDIRRSKRLIEDIVGCPVVGYRAPTFSIGSKTRWAYEILEEEGYAYSSSTYPIRHDLYGDKEAPRHPFRPPGRNIWEFPLTTRRLLKQNIPCAGGGYFRLLPFWISERNLRRLNERQQEPCIFYVHPWEIDNGQPRIRGITARTAMRHYINIKAMPGRLERLVRGFFWDRMDRVFASYLTDFPLLGQPTVRQSS